MLVLLFLFLYSSTSSQGGSLPLGECWRPVLERSTIITALKSPDVQRQAKSRETAESRRRLKASEHPSSPQARLAPARPPLPPQVACCPCCPQAVAGEQSSCGNGARPSLLSLLQRGSSVLIQGFSSLLPVTGSWYSFQLQKWKALCFGAGDAKEGKAFP